MRKRCNKNTFAIAVKLLIARGRTECVKASITFTQKCGLWQIIKNAVFKGPYNNIVKCGNNVAYVSGGAYGK